jgi:hypothetical protein
MIKVGVQSACGHSWDEVRPPNVAAPVNGELRACGHPECYPAQYPVTYSEPVDVDDAPAGLYCPECGKPPRFTIGDETAFCGTDGCRILKWDPKMTRAEIAAEGVHEISLGPEFRGGGT